MSEQRTYFELFDLPARYELDLADLEARYRELSRRWHPDRHGRAPAGERRAALLMATDLNQAYRVLKSESARAEYLLRLRGIDVAAESADKRLPSDPEFLGEILELREALQDARAAGDAASVRRLDEDVRERVARVRAGVAAAFLRLEAGDEAVLPGLARDLSQLRFYQRFRDEIEAHNEAEAERQGVVS